MLLTDDLQTIILSLVIRAGLAIVVLLIGRRFARMGRSWVQRALTHTDVTESVVTLGSTVTYYLIWLFAFLTALAILGVPTSSLISVSALVVVILAIALQASLGNFAATVIFLLFKPFQIGDLIETADEIGMVTEIQLFNTVLLNQKQQVVSLPNGKIQESGIVNYTHKGTVRVDAEVSIRYAEDLLRAQEVLLAMLAADPRVVDDPPSRVIVTELGESGVRLSVWPFVESENYWDVFYELPALVKLCLDQEGIAIPFPQRDVHLIQPDTLAD